MPKLIRVDYERGRHGIAERRCGGRPERRKPSSTGCRATSPSSPAQWRKRSILRLPRRAAWCWATVPKTMVLLRVIRIKLGRKNGPTLVWGRLSPLTGTALSADYPLCTSRSRAKFAIPSASCSSNSSSRCSELRESMIFFARRINI